MGSLTKKQRDAEEEIKRAIMHNYRLGKCDSEGRSIMNEHGHPVKKPRFSPSSAMKKL